MRIKILFLAIALIALSTVTSSRNSSDPTFGKGLFNFVAQDSTLSREICTRLQVRSIVLLGSERKPMKVQT